MMNITLPDDMERRLNIASVAAGLTVREYVAACLIAGMETHSRHDPLLAMVFQEARPGESRPGKGGKQP